MEQKSIQEYRKIATVKIKKGFLIFKSLRDPSEEARHEIEHFLRNENARFNSIVSNTFEVPEEGTIKFEFFWMPNRVQLVKNEEKVRFRTRASVTVLYLKANSLIYFRTEYLFLIREGCGSSGDLMYYGGKNYELEEIYFNKITTVGAYHKEELIKVVSQGCNAQETQYNLSEDGFVIRAGENFRVVASENYRSELADARNHINKRISTINQ